METGDSYEDIKSTSATDDIVNLILLICGSEVGNESSLSLS